MNKNQITNVIYCLTLLFVFRSIAFSQIGVNPLQKAYDHNSKIILDEFFMNWQKETPVITYEQLSARSDTVREVYNIYTSFFEAYAKQIRSRFPKYLVLEKMVFYEIDSTVDFNMSERDKEKLFYRNVGKVSYGKIEEFRPDIKIEDTKPVFFTDNYYRIYKEFFNPDTSIHYVTDAFTKKKEFLNNYTPLVTKGNFVSGEFYSNELMTDPVINRIVFNFDLQRAKIYFDDGCALMLAHLEKVDGKWEIKSVGALVVC